MLVDKINSVYWGSNNQELICKNNIVSKDLAYEFDKKRAYQITNGVNIFTIYNCDIK